MKKLFTTFLGLCLSLLCFGPTGCVTVEKAEVQVDEKKLVEELTKPENVRKVLGAIFSSEEDEAASEAEIKQFNQTKSKAQRGDANAQFTLGENFANGWGVNKDSKEAMKWYRKAANQGHKKAEKAVEQIISEEKEIAELKAKAEQGDAFAQHYLASAYDSGMLGLLEDRKEAFKWRMKAAEQGIPSPLLIMDLFYGGENQSIFQDLDKAVYFGNQIIIQLYIDRPTTLAFLCLEPDRIKVMQKKLHDAEEFEKEIIKAVTEYNNRELDNLSRKKLTKEEFIAIGCVGWIGYCWLPHLIEISSKNGDQRGEIFLRYWAAPYAWAKILANDKTFRSKKHAGDILALIISQKKEYQPDMFDKFIAKGDALAKELLKKIEANKKAHLKKK